MPKVLDEPGLTIYQHYEDNGKMSIITELACAKNIMPNEFKYFIENWQNAAKDLNPLIDQVEELEPVQGFKVAMTIAKAPWPLSARIMFSGRYPTIDFKPNEHVFVMSERGAESRINFTQAHEKDHVLAKLSVAGWHFSPISQNDKCVGTRIFYLACADAGGNIPSSVQNIAGPKQAK